MFPGTVDNCESRMRQHRQKSDINWVPGTSYDKIRSGDTCQKFVTRNGMTFAQLYVQASSTGADGY